LSGGTEKNMKKIYIFLQIHIFKKGIHFVEGNRFGQRRYAWTDDSFYEGK